MSLQTDLRNLAIKDAKNGDWKQAVKHNLEILELNSENTNALNRLGIAYVQLDKIPKAKKAFKQALVLDKNNKSFFIIAETEKYAHVTYFFRGMVDKELQHETRTLIPSIKAKNYVENPCMSAPQITDALIQSLQTNPKDFYLDS